MDYATLIDEGSGPQGMSQEQTRSLYEICQQIGDTRAASGNRTLRWRKGMVVWNGVPSSPVLISMTIFVEIGVRLVRCFACNGSAPLLEKPAQRWHMAGPASPANTARPRVSWA